MSYAALAGAAITVGTGHYQQQQAKKIHPTWDNDSVKGQLATAQNAYNGRMAGATQLENNIRASQGQTLSNINNNATDSTQALALGQQTQNQANDAYGQLQVKEAQNKYNLLDNLNAAYGANNANMKDLFNTETQAKAATNAAAFNNIVGGLNNVSSLYHANGGFGNKTDKPIKTRFSGSTAPIQSNATTPTLAGQGKAIPTMQLSSLGNQTVSSGSVNPNLPSWMQNKYAWLS